MKIKSNNFTRALSILNSHHSNWAFYFCDGEFRIDNELLTTENLDDAELAAMLLTSDGFISCLMELDRKIKTLLNGRASPLRAAGLLEEEAA